jgi:hypothetical protein
MPSTAHFASARSDLIVVESSSVPLYEGGRQIGTRPGRYHRFVEHRCKVEGQKSIDFMRERIKAPDGPGIWELDATDVPPAEALLAELATADIQRVRAILKAETDGPARTLVIDTAQTVLKRAGAAERSPGGQAPGRARHETVTA